MPRASVNESGEHNQELDLFVLAELPPARMAAARAHLEGCPACRAEAENWRGLFDSIEDFGHQLASDCRPLDEASKDLMDALASSGARAASPMESAPPGATGSRLAWAGLAVAAAFLMVLSLWSWAGGGWGAAGTRSENDRTGNDGRGEGVAGASDRDARGHGAIEVLNLLDRTGWEVSPSRGELLVRLARLQVVVDAGARLRHDDDGPPPRVELRRGRMITGTEPGGTLLVRIGDLELVVSEDSVVALNAEDLDEDDLVERFVIGVREGRASLMPLDGLDGFDPILLEQGQSMNVEVDGEHAQPGAITDLATASAAGALMQMPGVGAADSAGTIGVDETEMVDGIDEGSGPEGADTDDDSGSITEVTGPGSSAAGAPLRELPAGTVEVSIPDGSWRIGEIVPIEVLAGTGEIGLGSYSIEIAMRPGDSDLETELVSIPVSMPGSARATSPIYHQFDVETQVLTIADSTRAPAVPLGAGTLVLLRFNMRITGGSPGSHEVGGSVIQLVSEEDATSIASPRLQTRGRIVVERE